MATPQQAKKVEHPQTEEDVDTVFDMEMREKSPDALLSLLEHLRRQDSKASKGRG